MDLKTGAALAALGTAAVLALSGAPPRPTANRPALAAVPEITQGALLVRNRDGAPSAECPLKHTDVKAEITGFLARVRVTQEFENTAGDTVEAVYVFPLPAMSAVDDMTIHAGTRTIAGVIKRREEARAIYDAARQQGRLAALLDQERPNIFTQSVANIKPGERIKVEISYVERLGYEDGTYTFNFPMVVGPRYIPGNPVGRQAGGWAEDTDRVPDASRITPNVAVPGTRAGHDINVEVKLDAGLPIDTLQSATQDVDIVRSGANGATVRLRDKQSLPNKDFILKYDVAGRSIEDAVLAHADSRGGFFTMILQPPQRAGAAEITPKELVFVLDTSGSMIGFPIEKAKESMSYALAGLNSQDTFNLITFSGDTQVLFPQPVPATRENLATAQAFLAGRHGGGGTEMMKAIRAALDPSDSQDHVRVVCFMTDGYVGNDTEIVAEVKRHPNARVFSFGIGSSVNHYLLDKMAEEGRGEVEYVGLNDDGSKAARRFHERVRNPLLTDISVDWGGARVSELYPQRIPDLFSAKPVVITGRYSGAQHGILRLHGRMAGRAFSRDVRLDLPAAEPRHDVLATLWARNKVDHLMHEVSNGSSPQEAITKLGLDFRLMTPFTSFVAVEEEINPNGGPPRRVDVPVEIPDGVSYEGVFGDKKAMQVASVNGVVGGMPQGIVMRDALAMNAPASPAAMPKVEQAALREKAAPEKLHPSLRGLTGQVEVKVWVTARNQPLLDKLKAAGLVVLEMGSNTRLIIGRIDATKLVELTRLPEVTYIAPRV
jgi:Ca-activated chloride channel homolog